MLTAGVCADAETAGLRERAQQHERQERWLAASESYAELSRQQPGVPDWLQQARRCRQQARIAGRHLDPAAGARLASWSLDQVLDLCSEVLAKIEASHVSEVEMQRLFAHGLYHLELALQNRVFLERLGVRDKSSEALSRFRERLRRRFAVENIEDRSAVVRKVRAIAVGMQQDLGARAPLVVLEWIHAACEAVDDFGAFLPPDRLALEDMLAALDVAGIGIDVKPGDERLLIAAVAPDSPAARAGLKEGDAILRIDDCPVRSLDAEDALLRLLGRDSTSVTLEVQGRAETSSRRMELVRQRLSLPSITDARLVDMELGVGYIHIAYFCATTLEEFDLALSKLGMMGMRALILDLRGNPGGLFQAAVQLADRFLSTGIIITTRGRVPGSTVVYRTQNDHDVSVPLVVLIDGDSASASEIVAGAIKDHRRGILVGQRSFGKGSVQQVLPLRPAYGAVRLTTARLFSPLDACYNDVGVTPDIYVEPPMLGPSPGLVELQRTQFEAALRTARELLMKPL